MTLYIHNDWTLKIKYYSDNHLLKIFSQFIVEIVFIEKCKCGL